MASCLTQHDVRMGGMPVTVTVEQSPEKRLEVAEVARGMSALQTTMRPLLTAGVPEPTIVADWAAMAIYVNDLCAARWSKSELGWSWKQSSLDVVPGLRASDIADNYTSGN